MRLAAPVTSAVPKDDDDEEAIASRYPRRHVGRTQSAVGTTDRFKTALAEIDRGRRLPIDIMLRA